MKLGRLIGVLLVVLSLTACSSVPYSEGYPTDQPWALLPVVNHSEAPEAADLTQRALANLLSSHAIDGQQMPQAVAEGSNNLLSSASLLAQGKEWSKEQGFALALSTVVDQWQIDEEQRPQLALTLHLLDGASGERLWTTEAQNSGQPGQTPEVLLEQLLPQLLAALPLAP